jgi:hypothetical protein
MVVAAPRDPARFRCVRYEATMAFRLHPHQPLAKQVRALLVQACDAALDALARRPPDDRAVHEVRRCGKRSRALLRLVRDGLPRAVFERENRAWREVGRRLAGLRDSEVRAESVERLRRRYADLIPESTAAAVHHQLEPHRHRHLATLPRATADLRRLLEKTRRRQARLPLEATWDLLIDGHIATYRRARDRRHQARRRPSAARRHEWRKRVKDLRHQVHLLQVLWPEMMEVHDQAWDRLAEVLGLEHDLHVLARCVASLELPSVVRTQIRRSSRRWSTTLVARAERLGGRLHAEEPRAMRARLRAYAAVDPGR